MLALTGLFSWATCSPVIQAQLKLPTVQQPPPPCPHYLTLCSLLPDYWWLALLSAWYVIRLAVALWPR